MKTSVVLRLTMWLADCSGPAGEAFAGDLMESLAGGRTCWWCFSQVLQRVMFLAELRLRVLLGPMVYCAAFVFLYPLWQHLNAPAAAHVLNGYSSAVAWPRSAISKIVAGLLPALLFVWAGVFGFLLLRRGKTSAHDLARVSLSLSFGCSMVCGETILRLGSRPPELGKLSQADFYYPVFHAHFSMILFFALFAAVALLPRAPVNEHRLKLRRVPGRWNMLRLVRGLGLVALLVPHGAAQELRPQGPAAKRLIQLIEQFDSQDWKAFQAAYVANFLSTPPDVPLGNEGFRQRTGGFDLRKVEEDTPKQATLLVQEHNSDQFARISLEVEPEEPHRIVQLRMEPVERPGEFAHGSLTDAEVVTQARTRLHALADKDQFAGVMVIQHDGRTVYSEVLGEADRSRHIPNTMETRFRVGAVNKMFTAVATLQLVAAGKLQLDAPIGRYLPDYPNKDAAARVTVRHLLTHTGGTGDFFGPEFDAHRTTLRTHEDYVALFGPRPLRFTPGSRFEYSNYGFLILGAIIDRVCGESYYQYVQEHVYAPAGMTSTGSEPEEVAVPRRSVGYTREGGAAMHPNDAFVPYRGASAGGGYTTAGDLLHFAAALQQHTLLSARDTQLLLTPSGAQGGGERYGLGFGIEREPSGVCFGHSGGSPGQAAMMEVCPQAGYTIVWLANVDPPAALLLTEYLLHRLPGR